MTTAKDELDQAVENVLALCCLIATIVCEPWVICRLWEWFVVPLGVVPIRWSQAFGINLLIMVFVFRWPGERKKEDNLKAASSTVFVWSFALAAGYLVFKLSA